MYNPLAELTIEALMALINKQHFYFVRQSYPRGLEDGVKESLLISPYKTLDAAMEHLEAIEADHRKYLYLLDQLATTPDRFEADKSNLVKAAQQPTRYRVYLNMLKSHKWGPPRPLQMSIHEYSKRLGWGSRNMDVRVNLGIRHGHLIITLTNKGMTENISLDEIEKY